MASDKSRVRGVRLSIEVWDALEEEGRRQDRSVNWLIDHAIRQTWPLLLPLGGHTVSQPVTPPPREGAVRSFPKAAQARGGKLQ